MHQSRLHLARQLSWAESTLAAERQTVVELLSNYDSVNANTMRIGVSGTPGVGKSTFIEALGLHAVRHCSHSLAVLAVDPSSPLRGGSLLADKTRMTELSREEKVFIRPVPAGKHLGGLSHATREGIWLCEMAGYDTVITETVGVGQSEHEVFNLSDFFILLLQPGAGDELQGMKKGILELADIVVVNKADGAQHDLAKDTASQYKNALGLASRPMDIQVLLCSALEGTGIAELWDSLLVLHKKLKKDGSLAKKRALQNARWLNDLVHRLLLDRVHADMSLKKCQDLEQQVREGRLSVHNAAQLIVNHLLR